MRLKVQLLIKNDLKVDSLGHGVQALQYYFDVQTVTEDTVEPGKVVVDWCRVPEKLSSPDYKVFLGENVYKEDRNLYQHLPPFVPIPTEQVIPFNDLNMDRSKDAKRHDFVIIYLDGDKEPLRQRGVQEVCPVRYEKMGCWTPQEKLTEGYNNARAFIMVSKGGSRLLAYESLMNGCPVIADYDDFYLERAHGFIKVEDLEDMNCLANAVNWAFELDNEKVAVEARMAFDSSGYESKVAKLLR